MRAVRQGRGPRGKRLERASPEYWWHRLAAHHGQSVSRFRRETPPIDFLRGRIYLNQEDRRAHEREWKVHRKADYYLAQIAFEVYLLRIVVMNMFREAKDSVRPNKSIQDFLLEFKNSENREVDPKEKELELTPEEIKKRAEEKKEFVAQQSINRWMAISGMVGPRAANKG